VIDLVLQRADGWGIVEHKTDRQKLETLVASYASQVLAYARHWGDVTQEPVRYAGIFSVRERKLSSDLS
jgi:hypothetical protein